MASPLARLTVRAGSCTSRSRGVCCPQSRLGRAYTFAMQQLRWFLVVLAGCAQASAAPAASPAQQKLARDIYKELVEINTTDVGRRHHAAAAGDGGAAAAAGFPRPTSRCSSPAPQASGNLVARLRGTGKKKPMLLLAHLDVVEAKREDWTTRSVQARREGRLLLRRAAPSDDKSMAAAWVANMIRLQAGGLQAGPRPHPRARDRRGDRRRAQRRHDAG